MSIQTTLTDNHPMPSGAWPVMLTPFTDDGAIDWPAYDQLIDWYLASGVSGLFSVCLSSELYTLSEDERLALARQAVRRANDRVPVIAAGALGLDLAEMAAFTRRLSGTGVKAVVCLTNQFCAADGDDGAWRRGVEQYLSLAPSDVALGIYECPLPHARNLTADTLGWLAGTGRFVLTKDTCCNIETITAKVAAIGGQAFRFYNADARTLLASLQAGGHGYSGIAANYFPHLFSWLCAHFATEAAEALEVDAFLQRTNALVHFKYLQSAKHYLQRAGLKIGVRTRVAGHRFESSDLEALNALRAEAQLLASSLGIADPFASVRPGYSIR